MVARRVLGRAINFLEFEKRIRRKMIPGNQRSNLYAIGKQSSHE
ncbi:hypothetical protein LEP1GSC121_2014 [Leptospira borgpetersenii serovar Castellonis str. 200801910]|uniref:Uncharacterized protein n=1 Tax=Leptospira borgpetersenii str. Brem 328 TaxID=1049780 RepID=A0ABC9SH72_LEPBO|nr:hypothetical protein LEP1GSC121_2014 [Leptospira borgpetersenii serovar Castellonis str. 200801910]EMN17165.1 hypothetical protein LEP1GSC056_0527 [Leptospira borgpetersenii str. Brem 328]